MKIHCEKCKTYLGEIRDATLRRGTAYLCRKCEQQRKQAEVKMAGERLFDFLTDFVEKKR